MKMQDKLSILQEEYFHLQRVVEDYDSKALQIKNWCVTCSMFGIGTAFIAESEYLFLLSGMSAIIFYFIEVAWKYFQHTYYERIRLIESFYSCGVLNEEFNCPYIYTDFARDRKRNWKRIFEVSRALHVFLIYVVVFAVGVLLYYLQVHKSIFWAVVTA